MSVVRQENSKYSIEWKIQDFNEKDQSSSLFKVDGHDFNIFYTSFTRKEEMFCGFWLVRTRNFIFPYDYTLGFLNDKGQDPQETKGTVIENIWHQSLLGFFKYRYFTKSNLINNGTVTLHITLEPNSDGKKEPELSSRETERTALLESLSEDLGSFYDNKTNADCVLKVGESQFPVHRAVLSARSAVFAAMFNHDTKENRSGEVDIPDVDPTILRDVLYYIYSGKIRGLTPETAIPMHTVADKYALCKLGDTCLDVLLNSLTKENICDAAVFAHVHGKTTLEKKVIHFIGRRLEEFVDSAMWRSFTRDRYLLANKLLCSALITIKQY